MSSRWIKLGMLVEFEGEQYNAIARGGKQLILRPVAGGPDKIAWDKDVKMVTKPQQDNSQISDDEIAIYKPFGYTEAEAWKAVADKWRKAAMYAQSNADYYERQLSMRNI